jgi:RNA 2',3'-cyclic 3'-phosphodiesterase
VRLFVALDLPPEVHQELRELIEGLKKLCLDARWVRPEGIHITLKFIGHVDPAKAELICQALEPIRSDRPVEMQFHAMGFFPNERRPRVAWCGVEGSPNLAKLAADIDAAVEPLGIARESRAFTPHLTLARIDPEKVRHAQIEKLVEAAKKFESAAFGAAREIEFHLYESVTKPSGAEYKRLQSFPFLKGPA